MTDLDKRVLDILSDNFIGRPVGYFNFNGVSEAIKKIISEEVVKFALEVIGEDETEYPNTLSDRDGHWGSHNVNAMFRNQLRAEQRQRLASGSAEELSKTGRIRKLRGDV